MTPFSQYRFFKIRICLLVGIVFSFQFQSDAQDPAHFISGGQELANIHIYTILDAPNNPLLVGTDDGLYAFKHGRFEKVSDPKNKIGKSLFGLVTDMNGVPHCHNLNGQVFKYHQNKLELAYTLKNKSFSKSSYIQFDNQNNLIICGRNFVVTVNNGVEKILKLPGLVKACNKSPFTGDIIVNCKEQKEVRIFHDGDMSLVDISNLNFSSHDGHLTPMEQHFPELNDHMIIPNEDHIYVFNKLGTLEHFQKTQLVRYESLVDQEISFHDLGNFKFALTGGISGVFFVEITDDSITHSPKLFDGQFISCAAQNDQGVIYLGTFGDGLIVVPNSSLKKVPFNVNNETPKWLSTTENEEAYFSTDKASLYHTSATDSALGRGKRPFKLFYSSKYKLDSLKWRVPNLITDANYYKTINFPFSGLKDVAIIDSNNVLIADEYGVSKYGKSIKDLNWVSKEGFQGTHWKSLNDLLNARCRSIAFQKHSQSLAVATSKNLLVYEQSDIPHEYYYKDQPIMASDLEYFGNTLIVGTVDHGLLFYRNSDLIYKIDKSSGLKDNQINKLRLRGDSLFFTSRNGLYLLNLQEHKLQSFGINEGFYQFSIQDFDLSTNQLWFISNGEIYKQDINSLHFNSPKETLVIDSILVNGRKTEGKSNFSHSQNKFSFYIDYREFGFLQESKILFRLSNIDAQWKEHSSLVDPIEFKSLPSGEYTLQIKTSYHGKDGPIITYQFKISPPFWETAWFYVGLVLLSLLTFYLIYRIYLRWKIKRLLIQNELNSSKLTAIQSQMNPHFIFNALNSIQDQVLSGNRHESYNYINKFASLVRQTLDYSDRDLIQFSEELKLIQLYLSLEKLRFNQDFNFELNLPPIDGVLIPPMIIQPFIENSLIHGLMHKEGPRFLSITFELKTNYLECIVEDNGVGRKKAMEIKKRQISHHESFAIGANSKRFKILRKIYHGDFKFTYEDLYNEGQPAGTKVRIQIPAIREY
jgi:hypothetical protein